MQRKSRKILIIIQIIFLSTFVSGCWDSYELNKLAIVSGTGFDIDPQTGKSIVTNQSIVPSKVKGGSSMGTEGGQQGGATTSAVQIDHNQGDSWIDCISSYGNQGSRRLFFPHIQVDVIGREVAEQGVYPLIEHLLRLSISRPNRLLIMADNKAQDILYGKNGMDIIPSMGLASEICLSSRYSNYPKVELVDFANRMLSKTTAPILPIASVFEETDSEGNKFNKMYIKGTAVFKNNQLIGELDQEESKGLLWVIDQIDTGFIVIESPDSDDKASVRIDRSQTNINPTISNGKISIEIQIREESIITEYRGTENFDAELCDKFKAKLAETIEGQIQAAVQKSIALNADIFGFGEEIHRKYKKEWKEEIEPHWDDIYPTLEVKVKTKIDINGSGDIRKAIIPQQ